MRFATCLASAAAAVSALGASVPRNNGGGGAGGGSPSFTTINSTHWYLSNGGDFGMTLNNRGYAYSITWNGRELARNTTGGYSDSNAGKVVFNFTSTPEVVVQQDNMVHVRFGGFYVDVHYILFRGLSGHYQYVVNNALAPQGEVRSLYRLDPELFTRGRTSCKDDALPPISEIQKGYKVQDETWQKRDGSYITKYDFSCFQRESDYHGVYGKDVGAWVIAPGLDYIRGDHLSQELMVHRESTTNHAVLLHMTHGTHFATYFSNNITVGKMFGPWLFYINDGSLADAASRAGYEHAQWPYPWTGEAKYNDRAAVRGRLVLSDGRPASGAAVFLGDEDGRETNNQGEHYQYTTYAGDDGAFYFPSVRREKGYRLVAWANGGKLADVFTLHNGTQVTWSNGNGTSNGSKDVDLGQITWVVPQRETLWRIGDFDKTTCGFRLGDWGYQNGVSDRAPSDLVFSVGTNKTDDWYFAQTGLGNWTVIFDPVKANANATTSVNANWTAVLSLSFAGSSSATFSDPADLGPLPALNVSMNGVLVGRAQSNNDKALYRSATQAGGWQATQIEIPGSAFLADRPNRLDLTMTRNERWRGIMWDALKLERK